MQPGEFFTRVRLRADLAETEDARRITSGVLGRFGRLDLGHELQDAASQLPEEIGPMLVSDNVSEDFSADEFVGAVATELNVEKAEAEEFASAVITTLKDALTEGEFLDFNAALPEEFHRFLPAG